MSSSSSFRPSHVVDADPSLMQKLNKIAAENARKMIAQNFQDPSSLDDIAVLDMQLEKQLAIIEGQLNSAVQGKLDSLKRAVDLMDESVSKLNKINAGITNIDEKISKTNTQISNFQYLKKAHNARDNLLKVINQVNFFAEVPTKVEALKQQLYDNPGSLKEVYLESVKLESLRATLMKEMDSARRHRRRSTIGSGLHEYDPDSSVRRKVEDHLKHVPELVALLQQQIQTNIHNMFDLADTRPEDLVATFEIIEMQQEYNQRRNQAIAAKQEEALQNGEPNTDGEIMVYPNVISDVQTRIKQLLDMMVEDEFGNWQRYEEEGESVGLTNQSPANGLRIVGTRLLQRMEECRNIVMLCLPPHYDLLFIFVESLEKRLIPALLMTCGGERLEKMIVSDILDMISWLEYLSSSVENFGFPERESLKKVASLREELMFEYKERIKKQVHTWFENIRNREKEITQNIKDETLMTSMPEDMFNIIHAQVAVAREKLPLEYVHEVAIACMQVLQDMQRLEMQDLTTKAMSGGMDPETLCAMVNDNENMYEKCKEFSDSVTRILAERETEQKILVDIADEVAYQYSKIATQAVETLGHCIVEVLDEEVYQKLFSVDWEEQTGPEIIPVVGATLDDYGSDLQRWLQYYHYSKLMRFLLTQVVDRYVMSIRRKVDGVFVFRNEVRVSNAIVQDHKVLLEYFENHLETLKHGGLRPVGQSSSAPVSKTSTYNLLPAGANAQTADPTPALLLQEMESIHQLSVVISCRTLNNAESCARALFRKYGIDGMKVVQACFLCNPQLNKADKAVICDNVRKLFDQGELANGSNQKVPYASRPLEEYVSFDAGLDATVQNHQDAVQKAKANSGFSAFFRRR